MSRRPGLVVGMVHTVPALAPVFDDLVRDRGLAELAPEEQAALDGIAVLHLVDPDLLAALEREPEEHVHARVVRHVLHLARSGAMAVLVTCSSVAEAVPDAERQAGIPVLRVDGPMAVEAVVTAAAMGATRRVAGRVAILATVAATLGPTGRLVADLAAHGGEAVQVETALVPGAAAAREQGDLAAHDGAVRRAVDEASRRADVVVLAQASMASAVGQRAINAPGPTQVPILTSPSGGVAQLVRVAAESVRL